MLSQFKNFKYRIIFSPKFFVCFDSTVVVASCAAPEEKSSTTGWLKPCTLEHIGATLSLVAPWKIFVLLLKTTKKTYFRIKFAKTRKNQKKQQKIDKFTIWKKLNAKKCNKNCLGDQKIKIIFKKCALLAKIVALFEIFSLCAFLCYFWSNSVRLQVQNV